MISPKEKKVQNYIQFCIESMKWCQQQSENATSSIMEVLNSLMADSKRISKMSDSSIAELKKVKEQYLEANPDQAHTKVQSLTKALNEIRSKHTEIDDFINPIVEALQFQDRITQQMDNLGKMMDCWWKRRDDIIAKGSYDQNDAVEFGQELLKYTTMPEERNIIRAEIPGLPEEVKSVGLMF